MQVRESWRRTKLKGEMEKNHRRVQHALLQLSKENQGSFEQD